MFKIALSAGHGRNTAGNCDTVNPVYHRLSDLVGLYVERM